MRNCPEGFTPSRAAFSLLELGLVMIIIGGLAGVSVMLGGEWIKKEEVTTTKLLMDTVEGALDTYRMLNGRLPCPADITLTGDDANYGFEAYEAFRTPGEILGECVDSTGSDGSINAIDAGGDVSFGAVPAKTLGLSESVMRDQWGNLIGYYVTNRATREGSFWDSPRHSNFIAMDDNTVGAITIQDETGGVRTVDALYALVSHGRNEHGAYNAQGDRLDANAPTAQELENCDCDANAADTGTNSVLVARLLDESYDDLVQYKERRHLFNAVALGQCVSGSVGCGAAPVDAEPDAVTFTNITGAAVGTAILSNSVAVTGFDGSLTVTVTGDGSPQIRINGGTWETSASISSGDTLQVRLTSSGAYSTMRAATVEIGAHIVPDWTVTTQAAPVYYWVAYSTNDYTNDLNNFHPECLEGTGGTWPPSCGSMGAFANNTCTPRSAGGAYNCCTGATGMGGSQSFLKCQ